MSGSDEVGKTEYMPSEEGKTEFMPSEEGKTEFMPSEEGKTEFMPSEESKTEFMPSEEGKTEFMPSEESKTEFMPAEEDKSTSQTGSQSTDESIQVAEPKQKSRSNIRIVQTENHRYTIRQEGVYEGKKVYKVVDDANHIYVLIESRKGGDSDIYIAQDAKGNRFFVKEYRHDYENKDIFEIVGEYLKTNVSQGISKLLDYGELHDVDERDRVSPISKWYFVYPQYKLITTKPDDATFVKWVEVLNEALHEIHTNGRLVHRDIKPANLMLDPKTNLPVIIDFDAAALLDRKVGDRVYAETNGAFLTPEYASPETRNESSGYAEPASDYFSLGVTLAEIYSGMNLKKQSLFKDARDLNRQVLYNEISFPSAVEDNPNVLKLIKSLMCYKSRERAGYENVQSWVASPSDYKFSAAHIEGTPQFSFSVGAETFDSPESLAVFFSTHNYDCIMQWENGSLFRYIEKIRDDYKPLYDGFYEIKDEYENDKKKLKEADGRTLAPWQKAYAYAFTHILDPYTVFAWNDVIYPYTEIQNLSESIVNEVVSRGNDFDPLFESEFVWRYRLRLGKEESDRELYERLNLISGFVEMDMKKLLFAEALCPGIIIKKISGGKAKSADGFIKQYMDLLRKDTINGGIDRAGHYFYVDKKVKSLLADFVNLCNRSYMIDAVLVSGGYGEGYGRFLSQKHKKDITLREIFNAISMISAFIDGREQFAKDVLTSKQGIIEYFCSHMRNTEQGKWFVGNGDLAIQNLNQIHNAIKNYNDIVYESGSPIMWRTLGEFLCNLKEKIDVFYDLLVFDDDARKAYLSGSGKKTNYIICGKTGISVFKFWDNYRIASIIKTDLNERANGLSVSSNPVEYKDEDIIPGDVGKSQNGQSKTDSSEYIEWTVENSTAYQIASSMMLLFPEAPEEADEIVADSPLNEEAQAPEQKTPQEYYQKQQSGQGKNKKGKWGPGKIFVSIIGITFLIICIIGFVVGILEELEKNEKKERGDNIAQAVEEALNTDSDNSRNIESTDNITDKPSETEDVSQTNEDNAPTPGPIEVMESEDEESSLSRYSSASEFFKGDWYGWWTLDGKTDSWKELNGQTFDVFGEVKLDENNSGVLTLWDIDMPYENPIAKVKVFVAESESNPQIGTMQSYGGMFLNQQITGSDWIINPSKSGYSDYMMISSTYVDGNGVEAMDYVIHLKKWGASWDDFDKKPNNYKWYENMIETGEEMPRTFDN